MNLKTILEHYKFTNVIVVDDKVNISDKISLDELNQIEGSNLIKSSLYKFGFPEISKSLEEIDNMELTAFVKSVFIKEVNLIKLIEDLDGFNSVIKLSNLTDTSSLDNVEGNSVWIIDRHLVDKYDAHIKFLFEKYMSKIKNGNYDVMILYTQDYEEIKSYESMKIFLDSSLDSNLENEIMYINAISKDVEINYEIIDTIIQRIGKVLVFKLYNEQNKICLDLVREKIYNNEYYNYLVDYDYLSEGKSAYRAFSEILFNSHKLNYYQNIQSKLSYISMINNISDLKYCLYDDFESFRSKQIARLIKTFHQSLNTINIEDNFDIDNDDLHTGDIFKIDNKYFLIIHQACDITLRENGKRIADKVKMIEIKLGNSIDYFKFIRKRLRSVIYSARRDFSKDFPAKDQTEFENKIVKQAIKYINTIDACLQFNVNELMCDENEPNDIIKYADNYYEIMLNHKNVTYIESWVLDCAIYMEKQEDSFIVNKSRSCLIKRSTDKRIKNIKDIIKAYDSEATRLNIQLENILELILKLRIEKKEELILVPVKRIARLSRDIAMSKTLEVSNHETRDAFEDIVKI